jgi:hypothetical protein
MEEVIGSIPIRSTNQSPAESNSYSRQSFLRETKQGHKKGTLREYGTLRRTQKIKEPIGMTDGLICCLLRFSAGLIYDKEPRNVLLSCSFVLIVRLSVNVEGRPAVGMAHEFLYNLDPLFFLHQESGKRMPERMPTNILGDAGPDCGRSELTLQCSIQP